MLSDTAKCKLGSNTKSCTYRPSLILLQMPARLPNEIQDRTLDFLHNSKPALKASALVCRAWVPTSRYHLFSRIKLHALNADVFKNPHCTIRSCEHLEVCGSYGTSTAMTEVLQYLSTHLTPPSLILANWSYVLDNQMMTTFALFPSVERLWIRTVDIRDLQYLDNVLINVPNIRELRMTGCDLQEDGAYPLSFTSRLQSLEFSCCTVNRLLRYFRNIPTNVFAMRYLKRGDISAVGMYFSTLGNVLQEIRIEFSREQDYLSTRNITFHSAIFDSCA